MHRIKRSPADSELPVQLKTRLSEFVGYIPLSSMWRNVLATISVMRLRELRNPE